VVDACLGPDMYSAFYERHMQMQMLSTVTSRGTISASASDQQSILPLCRQCESTVRSISTYVGTAAATLSSLMLQRERKSDATAAARKSDAAAAAATAVAAAAAARPRRVTVSPPPFDGLMHQLSVVHS